jgi:hypothetical protein
MNMKYRKKNYLMTTLSSSAHCKWRHCKRPMKASSLGWSLSRIGSVSHYCQLLLCMFTCPYPLHQLDVSFSGSMSRGSSLGLVFGQATISAGHPWKVEPGGT